jgi:hypothetical protein
MTKQQPPLAKTIALRWDLLQNFWQDGELGDDVDNGQGNPDQSTSMEIDVGSAENTIDSITMPSMPPSLIMAVHEKLV